MRGNIRAALINVLVGSLLVGCGDDRDRNGWGQLGEPPPASNWHEQLPPCSPGGSDGRIDIAGGCVDGACADMTYSQLNVALGEVGSCEALDDSAVMCGWSVGLSAFFDDQDEDGVPDAANVALIVFVDEPFDGTTAEGLGLGISLACFVEVLGEPEWVQVESSGGVDWAIILDWSSMGVLVFDWGTALPDGYADTLGVVGAD